MIHPYVFSAVSACFTTLTTNITHTLTHTLSLSAILTHSPRVTFNPISRFRSRQLFDSLAPASFNGQAGRQPKSERERERDRQTKMKMRLLTLVNCGSFEMRTKRQLNLSSAPLIVVVVVAGLADNDAALVLSYSTSN